MKKKSEFQAFDGVTSRLLAIPCSELDKNWKPKSVQRKEEAI